MVWRVPFLSLYALLAGFGTLHVSVLLQSYLVLTAGMLLLLAGCGALVVRSGSRDRTAAA